MEEMKEERRDREIREKNSESGKHRETGTKLR